MARGSFKSHQYTYSNELGHVHEYELVCWKYRDIVYCMSNAANTVDAGSCYPQTNDGIKLIERYATAMIGLYNQHMGGVHLSDIWHMQCNSMLMGQNCWWLRLFSFYLMYQ
jgi:hypothetical protein